MNKNGLSRKEFLKLTVASALGVAAAELLPGKALAMESFMEGSFYDEPLIGQSGYEKRVARLFMARGLPNKATHI